jgi:diaminopimelate decarboxylase/aspartate kinase
VARHPLFDDEDPLSVAVPAVSPDVPLPVLDPDAPWVVLKFGGTSVSKRTRWDTIGRLAARRRGEGARVLLVVSAVSGVTNALQAIIDGHADAEVVRRGADALEARHREFASELGLDPQDVIGDLFALLHALAGDPRRLDAELQWQAELLSLGELLSSRLGAAYLRTQGLDLAWSDARHHLTAVALPNQSDWAGRLSVNCEMRSDAAWRERYAAQGELLITQGFICRDAQGRTAILGRGGSDTSAAYFGALLNAEAVEIWTDVPGMFSANPRQVPDARLLVRLDYAEAQEIATTGAKVLHPRCVSPVPRCARAAVHPRHRTGRTCRVPPSTRWRDRGTRREGGARASGIVLVSMESIGMWQQVGFLADVFEALQAPRPVGRPDRLLGGQCHGVARSQRQPGRHQRARRLVRRSGTDLPGEGDRAVRGHHPGGSRNALAAAQAQRRAGRVRARDVHLISQSSNDLNLTFVVDEGVAEGMLPRLHELLIQAGAMPVREHAAFGPSWLELQGGHRARREPWWRRRRAELLQCAVRGTPQYVYDLATVRERARALADVGAVERRFYAIKANPHPEILRTLEAEGFGFECVSAGEIEHVFATLPGLDATRVLFTPSFAPRAEYELALKRDVWITLDSVYPLRHWPELFHGRAVWLRLDPGFGRGHHDKVRTGGQAAKFGLPLAQLDDFLAALRPLDARVFGLHAHLGSGITDPTHWRDVLGQLAAAAEAIGTVAAINIGGGIGVPPEPEAESFDVDAFARALGEARAAIPQYVLWMEPGRYLVADAGVLLLRATQVVDKGGTRRIGADGGMNALMRPALYNAWHDVANLDRLDEAATELVDLVGPVCESSDVLAKRRLLPPTQEGDVLLVATAGAYGFAMANRYNLRALPLEATIDG